MVVLGGWPTVSKSALSVLAPMLQQAMKKPGKIPAPRPKPQQHPNTCCEDPAPFPQSLSKLQTTLQTGMQRLGVGCLRVLSPRTTESACEGMHIHSEGPVGRKPPLPSSPATSQSFRRSRHKSFPPQCSCFQKWKACPDTLLNGLTLSNTLAWYEIRRRASRAWSKSQTTGVPRS